VFHNALKPVSSLSIYGVSPIIFGISLLWRFCDMRKKGMMIADKTIAIFVALLLIVAGYNAVRLHIVSAMMHLPGGSMDGTAYLSGDSVIPKGVPDVYGKEMGIRYDDVSASDMRKADETIRKMSVFDQQLQLEGEKLQRYIDILYHHEGGMSCEYCCGAISIIFENGQAACGCAHSYAMRGLAKYLLTYHADAFTNEDILSELGKWKVLFFPTQMSQKASVMDENGIDVNYISLSANTYRGIETGVAGAGMVGGC
jgi:hypothetical protein